MDRSMSQLEPRRHLHQHAGPLHRAWADFKAHRQMGFVSHRINSLPQIDLHRFASTSGTPPSTLHV